MIVCALPSLAPDEIPAPFSGALVKPVSRGDLRKAMQRLAGDIQRILVVDDDPGMTEFLCAALGSINPAWTLACAPDAGQALALMRSFAPDVVLLDFGLPDMHGKELALQLHALRNIQILAVTAEDLASAISRSEADSITITRASRFQQSELESLLESITNALFSSTNKFAKHG